MSKIKLPHSSGNSMSIAAPATNPASDLELKLPATIGTANQYLKNSGTPGTLEFGTLSTPTYYTGHGAFKAERSSSAQSISHNTATQVQFNSETFDLENWYDTSTYKYTPQVAGYYWIHASIAWGGLNGESVETFTYIRKNGSDLHRCGGGVTTNYGNYHSEDATAIILLNGSSDYVDVKVYQYNSNSHASDLGKNDSVFMGHLLKET